MATTHVATSSPFVKAATLQSPWSRKDLGKCPLSATKLWTVGRPVIQQTSGVRVGSSLGSAARCGLVVPPRADGRSSSSTAKEGAVAAGEWQRVGVPRALERASDAEEVAEDRRSSLTVASGSPDLLGRRLTLEGMVASAAVVAAAALGYPDEATAVSSSRRVLRTAKIPESEYTELPNGLKFYDLKVGGGATAVRGSRVAIHYVAKWKGITFMTSRQGMGVTGGTPYGFDVGSSDKGMVLKGLDLGVQGMRENGVRLLIVPPQLAYGNEGVQEIPPNATLQFEIELLSIKKSPFGSRVKLIEG
ncbi:hypothetical protein CBR_g30794 [Chara braunii]|uniref:peptidylprolyl isomerase n=1 Tax=Chara braunii TaxID=69332 RepID=A0A388JXM8_CHABU|nr:hypothetical protein CBR_g30794 [Chara braunii]|eukprot:GBG62473.1 hypothetical protein CBR_g30794 [Chara braunii]